VKINFLITPLGIPYLSQYNDISEGRKNAAIRRTGMGGQMRDFSRRFLSKLLVILIVIAGGYGLNYFGLTNDIRAALSDDAVTLRIGDVHITPYDILKAVLTIIAVFYLIATISDFARARIERVTRLDTSTRILLQKATQVSLYLLAALISLNLLSIDLSALAVIGGAVGIGLGFGLQKIASNFISGVIILLEKSVRAGDIVELDNGMAGIIRDIQARYILLEAFDGREVMVPNEEFIANRVVNLTYSNKRGRLSFRVGVSYDSDLRLAKSLIIEAAHENPRVLKEPAPDIWLEDFADNAIVFHMRAWIDDITDNRFGVVDQINFAIWDKFSTNQIGIPFPQRVIHVKNDKDIAIDG
jgi:small-conductance mechanosensitive channel